MADEGCTFWYVGLRLAPRAWLPCVDAARCAVDRIIGSAHAARITGCLCNHFPQGDGHIPWHGDEVRAHGEAKLVVALSLGGERRLALRRVATGEEVSLRLPAGSAFVMSGRDSQTEWQHMLPPDGPDAPRRISLTFRSIVPGFEDERERAAPPAGAECT